MLRSQNTRPAFSVHPREGLSWVISGWQHHPSASSESGTTTTSCVFPGWLYRHSEEHHNTSRSCSNVVFLSITSVVTLKSRQQCLLAIYFLHCCWEAKFIPTSLRGFEPSVKSKTSVVFLRSWKWIPLLDSHPNTNLSGCSPVTAPLPFLWVYNDQ